MQNRPRDLLIRVLVALLVGSAVAVTAYLCAYRSHSRAPSYRRDSFRTKYEISLLHEVVEGHRHTKGQWPANLSEIEGVKSGFRMNDAGQVVDFWDHPYLYRVDGDGFTILSYGRDGQPGGDGDDADIDINWQAELPTLRRFTFEMQSGGIQFTCLLAGTCAGLITLLPPRSRNRIGILVRIGVTMVGSVIAAVYISAVHIPSGH